MTDEKTYEDGKRDAKMDELDKRTGRLERLVIGICGAIAAAYAKLTGIL